MQGANNNLLLAPQPHFSQQVDNIPTLEEATPTPPPLPKQPEIELKLIDDVTNGVMKIEIVDLDNIVLEHMQNGPAAHIYFIMHYELPSSNNNDFVWQRTLFNLNNINENHCFYLKVPVFGYFYSLYHYLTISFWGDSNNEIYNMESSIYSIEIPSMSVEPEWRINDHAQFEHDENSSDLESGRIVEILENDMIKIKDDISSTIITTQASKIYRHPVDLRFVVDITQKKEAIMDVILAMNCKNVDESQKEVYYKMMSFDECNKALADECLTFQNGEGYQSMENMVNYMTRNIIKFLDGGICSNYRYRIKCPFNDDGILSREETWNNALDNDENAQQNRIDCCWSGYICDICRVEMSWYDCYGECSKNDEHMFCITCIYSMVMEYNKLKPLLLESFNDMLSVYCIEEIIKFCAGDVAKFDVKKKQKDDDIEMNDNDKDEDELDVINDNKNVGSKRSIMSHFDRDSKRRRLQ